MEMKAGTDPESTFIASACECGVAVQGDAQVLSSYANSEPSCWNLLQHLYVSPAVLYAKQCRY